MNRKNKRTRNAERGTEGRHQDRRGRGGGGYEQNERTWNRERETEAHHQDGRGEVRKRTGERGTENRERRGATRRVFEGGA